MTPIIKIHVSGCKNTIYIKRDDLLPFSFGGNKVRIAQEFLDDMKKKNADCLIGYGNARSNLCRALANLCVSHNIPCHIVSPSDDDGTRVETFNSLFSEKCGVTFHLCRKNNVAETVDAVMKICRKEGFSPYYIYGDSLGKGNKATPVKAYVKAYSEIKKQTSALSINPSYLFLATGTGMTQSGLLMGQMLYSGNEKIVGISIARDAKAETNVIETYLECYENEYQLPHHHAKILVDDSYRCEGYGFYNNEIADVIDSNFKENGIPLDPTYTGKAFWGMLQYLQKHHIEGHEILFLHTGGTPLFFDYMKYQKKNVKIKSDVNVEQLFIFLKEADQLLPTPLSIRVDLMEYAQKVVTYGRVFVVEEKGKIVSAVLFYANDFINRRAYLSLLATLPEYQRRKLGDALLTKAEETAKEIGMRYFTLETDFSNNIAISYYAHKGYQVEFTDMKLHMKKEL